MRVNVFKGEIKMADQKVSYNGGIGLFGFMFLILFALKLGIGETVVMGWSWWWITAPLWAPVSFLIVVLLAGAVCAAVVVGLLSIKTRVAKRHRNRNQSSFHKDGPWKRVNLDD
jgi:hypothetical protein